MLARSRTVWTFGFVVLAALAVALLINSSLARRRAIRDQANPNQATPNQAHAVKESANDVLRLVTLKDVGLARLENDDLAASDAAFAEIAKRATDDPLGPRNLTITRLFAAEKTDAGKTDAGKDPEARAAALGRLREAVSLLKQVEPAAWTTDLLESKAARLANQTSEALQSLAAASKAAPNDPSIWYELYATERDANEGTLGNSATAAAALKRAFELEPDNLFLLLEWLGVQSRSKDPKIAKTLAGSRAALSPLAAVVQQFAHVDVLALTAAAQAAAQKADWPAVARNIAILGNVCRADAMVQADRRRVIRNLMEYALDDLSPAFYQTHGLPPVEDPSPIEVAFRAAKLPASLERLRDVRDVALADFDLDGRLDLCVLTSSSLELFIRGEGASEWKKVSSSPLRVKVNRILAVDLDNDFAAEQKPATPVLRGTTSAGNARSSVEIRKGCSGAYVDIAAYGSGGLLLFHNVVGADGTARKLELVDAGTDVGGLKTVTSVAAVDLDGDGDLDLAISTTAELKLLSNHGGMTFADMSGRSDLSSAPQGATDMISLDWDRDVDADVLLADPAGPIGLLENERHGRFRFRKLDGIAAAAGRSTALAVIDPEGKASWDLLAAGPQGVTRIRTQTPQQGRIQAVAVEPIDRTAVARMLIFDYDNDGRSDLLLLDRAEPRLLRGVARGRFVPSPVSIPAKQVTAGDTGDLDDDGDVDLAIVSNGRVMLLLNEGGNRNHWLEVNLHAMQVTDQGIAPSGRVNSSGVGSLLELKTGGRGQAQIVRKQTSHFGLGATRQVDVLRVMWTNGVPSNVIDPPANMALCERQSLKGSCPFLYAWNGARFDFVTDLLWAAPLGMQAAEGVIAPDRSWEYLKVSGDAVVPRGGEYHLKITEELWEATYLDQVELIAVDHPAGVEIYSNEKVGPAELAPYRIHTVTRPQTPLSARNHAGRNLLPELSKTDGVYARPFEKKLRQGLVDQHFIEIDLGKLGRPASTMLFLTGWVLPTDTSISVALTQDSSLAPPRPPSLWVPDGSKGWREAIPFMGFPGGKTKTIAVDVTKVLRPDDGRLRIVGSREIYWDAIFFTVDEPVQRLKSTPLPLLAADLHFRGFSEPRPLKSDSPETFDYDRCSRDLKWPPMGGRFTRYGDVGELLKAADDRLVAFGAGDEISLRFQAPPDPPAGWRRDFILHNVGWDKDADLNTVVGETVEPLPLGSMPHYPNDGQLPAARSGAYERYLHDYQTREQHGSAFWKQMRSSAAP